MALDSYANLQASMAEWLWRTDETNTETYIPDMITMAEAHFNRVLRVDDMDSVSSSLSVTDGVATMPTGFREMRSLRLVNNPGCKLTYRPADYIENLDDDATADPQYWTRIGGELHIWPRKTVTLRMRYRTVIPALADDNTSNWLLEKHPDLYLNGGLAMGEAFNMNDERIGLWKAETARIIAEINSENFLIAEDGLEMPASTVAI